VSDNGFTYRYDGTSWTPGANVGGQEAGSVSSVSCGKTSVCVAVGPKGDVYGYDDTRWVTGKIVGQVLTSVWCSPSAFDDACHVVSQEGHDYGTSAQATFGDDGRWPFGGLTGISCLPLDQHSGPQCQVIAPHGRTAGLYGDFPHETAKLGSHDLTSVSCPGFCEAVDDDGNFYSYSYFKSKWLSAQRVDAQRRPVLTSLSCPTASPNLPKVSPECVTVSNNGYAYLDDGSWTSHRLGPAGRTDLTAVSCSAYPGTESVFCAVVSRGGQVFTYRSPSKLSAN
jgi:hypothetical protein